GDCVVTFSRLAIYQTKELIEAKTGMRCAVIYGGLPPESRVEQAKLFNDPESGYDVLVASDAVGMGINLTINRVVFMALEKFDGSDVRPVSVSLTRQIGGRAGRFGSGAKHGYVTAMEARDMKMLKANMTQMPPSLMAAGINPTLEVMETFSHQFPKMKFSQLWPMLCDMAEVDDGYFICSFSEKDAIAETIEDIPLSIGERYQLLYAPVSVRDDYSKMAFRKYAKAIAFKSICKLASVVHVPDAVPASRDEIRTLEQRHRMITLYLWLSYHYPESFSNDDESFEIKTRCETLIQAALINLGKLSNTKTTQRKAAAENAQKIRQLLGINS
ncbi:RNA helicase, partial [Coemansia nantahalensis]